MLHALSPVVEYLLTVKGVTLNKTEKMDIVHKRTSGFKPVELVSKSPTGLPPRLTSPRVELGGRWWNPSGIMSHCAAVPLHRVDCCGHIMAECIPLI